MWMASFLCVLVFTVGGSRARRKFVLPIRMGRNTCLLDASSSFTLFPNFVSRTIVEHVLTHSLSSDENRCDWVKCDDDRKSFVLVNHFKILFLTWTGNEEGTIWGEIRHKIQPLRKCCCLCAAYKLDGDSARFMTLSENTFLHRFTFLQNVHNSKTFLVVLLLTLSLSLSLRQAKLRLPCFLTVYIDFSWASRSMKAARENEEGMLLFASPAYGWKMNNNNFIWSEWKKGTEKILSRQTWEAGKSLPSLNKNRG